MPYLTIEKNELVIRLPIGPRPTNPTIAQQLQDGAQKLELKAAYQWDHETIAVALTEVGKTENAAFLFFIGAHRP